MVEYPHLVVAFHDHFHLDRVLQQDFFLIMCAIIK